MNIIKALLLGSIIFQKSCGTPPCYGTFVGLSLQAQYLHYQIKNGIFYYPKNANLFSYFDAYLPKAILKKGVFYHQKNATLLSYFDAYLPKAMSHSGRQNPVSVQKKEKQISDS